jgi:hypothetical protein
MKSISIIILLLFVITPLTAQDWLTETTNEEDGNKEYVTSTFKATRLLNGQSIENPAKKELIFIVSHRFGKIDQGIYDLFGMDNATIRLGLEYGITDRLAIGAGRSSYEKTFDGFIKYNFLKQHTGIKPIPFSMTLYTNIMANSLRTIDTLDILKFKHRLSYSNQLLIASKINRFLSMQIFAVHLHTNLTEQASDDNDMLVFGLGGRILLTRRISFNTEYFYLVNKPQGDFNPRLLSIGFDLETGGHVFQLFLSNTQPHFEKAMFAENTSYWLRGDIYFGFNISRTFSL